MDMKPRKDIYAGKGPDGWNQQFVLIVLLITEAKQKGGNILKEKIQSQSIE